MYVSAFIISNIEIHNLNSLTCYYFLISVKSFVNNVKILLTISTLITIFWVCIVYV